MNEVTKPVVIYHKGCADGIAAAWSFWKQFGDTMEYYPGVYGSPLPDIYQRDVYLVDFSYKRDLVQMMCQYASKVVLLDHHTSALNDLWDLAGSCENFDMSHCTEKKSGAMIAWDYVRETTKHRRKMPELLKHVQDRDLWKFELAHTKEVMAAVFSYELSIESFEELTKTSPRLLAKQGTPILRMQERNVFNIIQQTQRYADIGGRVVPVFNCNYMFASDVGDVIGNLDLSADCFSATYYDTKEHRIFSLRSKKPYGADVAEIAKLYGGGGHKHAAGFKVSRTHDLAKI